MTTRSVVIINNTLKSTHKTIFTSTLKFTYKSGETVFLTIEGGELINNTGSKLYIETVEYGNGIFGSENNNQIIAEIEPYSCSLLHQRIDFYFFEPPSRLNISRKLGEPMPNTVIKYWLHK